MLIRFKNDYVEILPELDEEWSSLILGLKEVVQEKLSVVNKVCRGHL